MKCIKFNVNEVYRISDKVAKTLVARGDCVYTSKSDWKNLGRKYIGKNMIKHDKKMKGE